MADFGSLANLALVSKGVEGAATVGNAYAQSQAIRGQGSYERQQMNANAQIADLQAQQAATRGQQKNTALLRSGAGLVGSQRVAYAGQGVDVGAGSAAEVQADTAGQIARDAETIQNNAYREGWGYRVEGGNFRDAARMRGLATRNDANMTLLTGGLGFGRDALQAAYLMEKYGKKPGVPAYNESNNSGEEGV